MDIQILKRFSKIKRIRSWETKGLSIIEIEALETKYNQGNPFPKAYREYLFIGGKMHGIGIDKAQGYDWLQEAARKELAENNQTIDRPFFVMDQLDGCEQFGFFYLDENEDDPIIYNCRPPYVEEGYSLIHPYGQLQFSKVIDSLIDEAEATEAHFGSSDD